MSIPTRAVLAVTFRGWLVSPPSSLSKSGRSWKQATTSENTRLCLHHRGGDVVMVGVAEILTHGRRSVALSQTYFKNNSTTSSRVLMVTRSIVGGGV